MASDRGATATEAPRASSTVPQTTHATFAAVTDLSRQKSLKRARETTPTSQDLASSGDISPSKIARLVGFARQSHHPSAGEAAEDEGSGQEEEDHQQQLAQLSHDNQSSTQKALDDLMSGVAADMNRAQDAPSDTGQLEIEAAAAAAARALSSVNIPTGHVGSGELQDVSPQSGTSGGSLEDGDGQVVDSPAAMDIDSRNDHDPYAPQPEAQMEDKTVTSLSYPGALPAGSSMSAPSPLQRGMSMPMHTPHTPGSDLAPRSPSSKKHKCPYCETEFTRHHNLKSHLLTHSQEKPYVCQSCQMRFRRLHDLKRHSKLHTGEKPHVCPSCDRKFARGDALARHSKGAGGCAGRRQTMGAYTLRDGYDGSGAVAGDDSALSGDLYEGDAGADMTEEERRRLSMPSIKTQHVAGQAGTAEGYGSGHPNTYPPPGQRPGGLYPPNADRGSSSSNTSPSVPTNHTPHTSISSMPLSASGSVMYSQGGMTESPKPLSPGIQPIAGGPQRPGNDQHPAASGLSLPSHGMSPAAKQAWLSQYPPADRDATEGNPAAGQHAANAARVRSRAASGAASTQGTENNNFGSQDASLWVYFQHLEAKVKGLAAQLEAEARSKAQLVEKLTLQLGSHDQHINALTAEVAALRQQLAESQEDGSGAGSVTAQP